MSKGVENIGKSDVLWGYIATIFMVGSGVILLPFVLHKMPAETVGIWNIFTAITGLVTLLDFGFRPSFARNISYIFSGVKSLKKEGVSTIEHDYGKTIDYSLLSGTIEAMKFFYRRMSLVVLALLATCGTAYFIYILGKYSGNQTDAFVAWVLLICINSYNLYTLYFDALLMGKGYVKRNQQFTVIGQVVYLGTAVILIYLGLGLSAIIASKLLSVLIRRYLSYRTFFSRDMKAALANAEPQDANVIFKAIMPNAVKVGCTNLGGFLVNKSALFLGSAFLSLEEIACYGITMQVVDIIMQCGNVIFKTYIPKLAQYRASKDFASLRQIYKLCVVMMVIIYIGAGGTFILFGEWAMSFIGSSTHFLATPMVLLILFISYLECNHSMAAGFLSADNRIPFFIPSLLSGAATVVLLWLFMGVFNLSIWGMILAPGIAQLCYQNWKWPLTVMKEIQLINKK